MRTAGWALFLLPVLFACGRRAGNGPGDSGKDAALRAELENMGKGDQLHREEMSALMKQGIGDPEVMKRFEKVVAVQGEIDVRNMNRPGEILQREGWPGYGRVGKEAGAAAFMILQHAELKSQQKYFPLLKEAAKRQEASPADAAMMEDRIRMREGQNQIYGSQLVTNKKTGKPELWPIENEEEVDGRRAAEGMPPMAEYLRDFNLEYHPPLKK